MDIRIIRLTALTQEALALLEDLKANPPGGVSVVVSSPPPVASGGGGGASTSGGNTGVAAPTQPAKEAPRALDACKPLWEAAQKAGLFNIFDYEGVGLQTGLPHLTAPRMSQETQDKLEADIRALGRSAWGQEWLSHDANAELMDRRYCFDFIGYWVTRKSHNPDDGWLHHTTPPPA